ncbi:MAG: hypothetical protein KDD02_04675 [Phaeodactylibacter sp.]|nr:hypothetical protein [Phaeodactylibacter sp.]MCB9300690.1 hypothetical protein [Lewinellaceae bacterium]
MGLLDRLFGAKSEELEEPKISFGRYSDSYKDRSRYTAWDTSLEQFEKKEYLESYKQFFYYLRDEEEDNVRYEEAKGGLKFELYQGSKKITGLASPQKVWVEARVVRAEALNVGFMRRLMEQNYNLRYSRFALDDEGNITIVFDTYTLDGSPYKLYYALKELATKADKQDDLLLEEFQMLQAVDASHMEDLPLSEKEAKYSFLRKKIEQALYEIDNGKLDKNQYAGSMAYLLLDLIYRLDYLIKPEGFMMETLEHLHRQYYENDNLPTAAKNQVLCKGFRHLLERDKSEFFKEMYRVKSTFGITHSVTHDRVAGLIDAQLSHMDWYKEHGYEAVALAIPGFIVGQCMFNFAVPKPDRELFHLYYQTVESDYFKALGFPVQYYDTDSKQFDKRAIKRAITRIVENNKPFYSRLNPASSSLNFDSLPDFAQSFLLMVRDLDMVKTD